MQYPACPLDSVFQYFVGSLPCFYDCLLRKLIKMKFFPLYTPECIWNGGVTHCVTASAATTSWVLAMWLVLLQTQKHRLVSINTAMAPDMSHIVVSSCGWGNWGLESGIFSQWYIPHLKQNWDSSPELSGQTLKCHGYSQSTLIKVDPMFDLYLVSQ